MSNLVTQDDLQAVAELLGEECGRVQKEQRQAIDLDLELMRRRVQVESDRVDVLRQALAVQNERIAALEAKLAGDVANRSGRQLSLVGSDEKSAVLLAGRAS